MNEPRCAPGLVRVTSVTLMTVALISGAACYDDRSLGIVSGQDGAAGGASTGAGGSAGTGGGAGVAGTGGGPGGAAGGPGVLRDAGAAPMGGAGGSGGATGPAGAGGQGGGIATCPTGPRPGRSPLRRLTRTEYAASVRDALGVTAPIDELPAESTYHGFEGWAEGQVPSELFVRGLLRAAQSAAQQAAMLPALVSCATGATSEESCGLQIVTSVGRDLFRRPLSDAELAFYGGAFQTARRAVGFAEAVRLTLQTMLLAPRFVYRLEIGPGTPSGEAGIVRADGYDLATRLAYTLWATTPDDALLKEAGRGTLATADGVASVAERMWADPRARRGLREFTRQWLDVDQVAGAAKDPKLFPAWTPTIAGHLQEEVYRFVDDVVFVGDGLVRTLVTSTRTWLNGPLATFYGVPGPTGSEFVRVDLPAARSAGLLTKAGLLAGLAHGPVPTPMQRGLFVLNRLLCDELEAPPASVSATPQPPTNPNTTLRQRWEEVVFQVAECFDCHVKTDYMGFALEHFDAIGRWRDLDNGQPIDDSGRAGMPEMAIKGPAGLGAALASDPRYSACMATLWFRYAQGRPETKDEACVLKPAQDQVQRSGRFASAALAVTSLPTFQYRPAPVSTAAPTFSAPGPLDLPGTLTAPERASRQTLWTLDLTIKAYQAYAPLVPADDRNRIDAFAAAVQQTARSIQATARP